MITKIGENLVKEALLSAVYGGYRASELSDKQRAALKKHYGLDDDASLTLRNAGRGFLGGMVGSTPGSALRTYGLLKGNPALAGLGGLGMLAGYVGGARTMTNKYSPENADRIMGK